MADNDIAVVRIPQQRGRRSRRVGASSEHLSKLKVNIRVGTLHQHIQASGARSLSPQTAAAIASCAALTSTRTCSVNSALSAVNAGVVLTE
jgi:hypothetical protein